MTSDLEYAHRLIAKGIELYVDHRGKLRTWPKGSYRESLDGEERAYFQSHRDSLTAFVVEGLQPKLPEEPPAPVVARSTAADCPYCCRPCVGPSNRWFRALHWNEPSEVARRKAERAARDAFDRRTWQLREVL
jgi:hypothetical protein